MTAAEPTPTSLLGRKALVLGAGTPAGRRIAVALAEAGADVAVASASLDGDEVMACRRTRRAVEALGRRTAEYAFDVTLGQNVQVSTRQVAKELGGLDVLVWAVHQPQELVAPDKITDAEWSRGLAVGLSGAFFAARAALREMLAHDGGRLIFVIHGGEPAGGERVAVTNAAADSGIRGLSDALTTQYHPANVRSRTLVLAPADSWVIRAMEEHGEGTHEVGALAVQAVAEQGGSNTAWATLQA